MNVFQKYLLFCTIWLFILSEAATGQEKTMSPVTKHASPEARALLNFFYRISGQYILTGQHNYPDVKGRNTKFAEYYTGKMPVIYSTDWGFAKAGNTDSYLARQDIVDEAIRQNKLGAIVTICWHAVPPTANEPVTFQPLPNADTAALASFQGKLTDQQFKDVLTPGTVLYKHWCTQVDSIAVYLKKLQDAHVPVLWRPYHEMNGDWFWWGGRLGEYSTVKLYRQLFDRLVNYHKLNNLIWIWSVDRPGTPVRKFSNFYPGNGFLDILALDVYGSDFNQNYYDSLLALSMGKPIVLGEVGNPPTPEILKRQPKWSYYVIWAGMVRNTLKKQYETLYNDSHVLCLDDAAYRIAIAPYRSAAGLSSLTMQMNRGSDFLGEWTLDEEKSKLEDAGTGNLPYKIKIIQKEKDIAIERIRLSEYADDMFVKEDLLLNGGEKEFLSPFGNAPGTIKAYSSEKGDTLFVDSKISFKNAGKTNEWITKEVWTIQDQGKVLSVRQTSAMFRGKKTITAIFDKQ